jgi:Na+-translocating ferredoxin:NAD+ oxidoreductase RnfG subunit
MIIRKLLMKLAALALLSTLLVGCYSKITKENYDKIQTGMTLEEVKNVLGEPTESNTLGVGNLLSGTNAVWKNEETTITIKFLNDKVQFKTFSENK